MFCAHVMFECIILYKEVIFLSLAPLLFSYCKSGSGVVWLTTFVVWLFYPCLAVVSFIKAVFWWLFSNILCCELGKSMFKVSPGAEGGHWSVQRGSGNESSARR